MRVGGGGRVFQTPWPKALDTLVIELSMKRISQQVIAAKLNKISSDHTHQSQESPELPQKT
jgi:hypothetical protein